MLLEITQADVDDSPKIQHLFSAAGGTAKIWEYLSGSEKDEARAVLKMKARLTLKQFQSLPFEAFCVAAKIHVTQMFGVIASEVLEQSTKAADLIARIHHPSVVEATVERALKFDGTADALQLHKALQFVPVPKNSFTLVKGNTIDASQKTVNVTQALPPVEDIGRRLSNRFGNEMELPAIAAPAEDADFEDVEDDEETL